MPDVEEDRLAERVAREMWADLEPAPGANPKPERPVLVIMVGVPLSGKSTLARALAVEASTATVIVENDAVRERVAFAMGRVTPTHDRIEHFLTYQAAWTLVRLGLATGHNVIHDATNLNEKARKGAYDAADDAGARVLVVFVLTPQETAAARAAAAGPDRQLAFDKLGSRRPNPGACSRAHVVVDGTDAAKAAARVFAAADAVPLNAADRTS